MGGGGGGVGGGWEGCQLRRRASPCELCEAFPGFFVLSLAASFPSYSNNSIKVYKDMYKNLKQ